LIRFPPRSPVEFAIAAAQSPDKISEPGIEQIQNIRIHHFSLGFEIIFDNCEICASERIFALFFARLPRKFATGPHDQIFHFAAPCIVAASALFANLRGMRIARPWFSLFPAATGKRLFI
jgi:hypothetical protein